MTLPSAASTAAEMYVAILACLVIGVATGMVLSRRAPRLLLVLVAVVIAAALYGYWAVDALRYPNANAALAVQLSALVALALQRARVPRLWVVVILLPGAISAWLESAGLGWFTWLAVVVAAVMPPISTGRRRLAALAGWLLVMVLPVVQVGLVLAGARPHGLLKPLSEARFILWSEALKLAAQRPLLGHGPGSFSELNMIRDVHPYYLHAHSSFLEVAAELGLAGLAVLVLIVSAGFALLSMSPGRGALLAIVAWTGLWVHSLFDFVADYPQIILVAGLVVGVAAGHARVERRDLERPVRLPDHA